MRNLYYIKIKKYHSLNIDDFRGGKKQTEKIKTIFSQRNNNTVKIDNIEKENLKPENTTTLKTENENLKKIIENNEKENLKTRNNINLKIENENLNKENKLLKSENQILKKENQNLKYKLDNLNLIKNEEIKKLNEKFKLLNEEKMKIIENLNSKLNSNVVESKNYNGLPHGEKLIALNFISVDKHINHNVICKNKTKFFELEKELYGKYPEYSNENFFIFNGLKINKWKTLEENGINGYTITLKTIDK